MVEQNDDQMLPKSNNNLTRFLMSTSVIAQEEKESYIADEPNESPLMWTSKQMSTNLAEPSSEEHNGDGGDDDNNGNSMAETSFLDPRNVPNIVSSKSCQQCSHCHHHHHHQKQHQQKQLQLSPHVRNEPLNRNRIVPKNYTTSPQSQHQPIIPNNICDLQRYHSAGSLNNTANYYDSKRVNFL